MFVGGEEEEEEQRNEDDEEDEEEEGTDTSDYTHHHDYVPESQPTPTQSDMSLGESHSFLHMYPTCTCTRLQYH